MRRTDFYASSINITKAMSSAGVFPFFERFLTPNSHSPSHAETMEVYRRFTLASASFGASEKYILDLFGLGELLDADFWAQVMAQRSDRRRDKLERLTESWKTYSRIMPGLVELLVSDRSMFDDVLDRERPESQYVSFLLTRPAGSQVTLKQVEHLFRAMEMLSGFVKEFYGIDDSDIILAYCDTGSITELVFSSSSKCIYYIRSILIAAWRRLFFPDEEKAAMQIDRARKKVQAVAEALPVLAEINFRRRELGAKTAKALEGTVVDALANLVESGAVPRECVASQPEMQRLTDMSSGTPKLLEQKSRPSDEEAGS